MSNSDTKSLFANLLLAAVSFVVTVLVIEFAVSPRVWRYLPLKVHGELPRGYRVLAQSSKRSTVPEDYIALLGDSYAQGRGDWLHTVDANRNPPFHSAHLIRDATGRDVVTFGKGGAGSLRGLVAEPFTNLAYLKKTALFAMDDPESIVFYFYEGNDLGNNIEDLAELFEPRHDITSVRDPDYFREFLTETVIGQSRMQRDVLNFTLVDNFVVTKFAIRLVKATIANEWADDSEPSAFSTQKGNLALIGGEEVSLPDRLYAPSLELSDDEIDLALYVHEQAFAFLVERFPEARIGVVYIPSPAATYRITSPRVAIRVRPESGRRSVYDTRSIAVRSDRICGEIARIARAAGADFADLRPHFRRAAETELVHGVRDWKHLNRRGYEILADGVISLLEAAENHPAGVPFQGCASMQAHSSR